MKKITFLVLSLLVYCNTVSAQNIVINEVLASNTTSIQDEDGSKEDWIELYNKGAASVNLAGYGLSDDVLIPYKWTFPNVTLAPGQYLIIWASDKNRSVAGNPLHANFKISASGETITLTNTSAVTVDTAPPANLPSNVSYGRSPNGTGPFVYFGTPTPNAANTTTGYAGTLNPPVFSQNSGFFTTAFNLSLSSTDPGTTILYTLDGSDPDENNLGGTTYTYKNQYPQNPGQAFGPLLNNSYSTQQYTAPLAIVDRSSQPNDVSGMSSTFDFSPTYIPTSPVFKGTTVRVKVIKPGYLPSKTITKTYFVTPQGSNKFSLPVVSINLNEDRFFDYNNGIFVAGKDFDDWRTANPTGSANASGAGNYYRETDDERPANMSYFVNGVEVISQDIGLRIRGGSSRRFQSKSLTVYARSDYGDNTLDYKFFPTLPYTSYERLTLSNSGGDFQSTMFRDPLDHEICKELLPEKEAYQPTITFVNGEYWGILNLRERYDDEYFKRVYNADEVDFLENDGQVKDGDHEHYEQMIDYLNSHSLNTQANFDYFKTLVDTENAADYFIANIFLQNEDWPNNNVYFWRNKIAAYDPTAPAGLDGRWRYLFHDMDNTFAFGTGDPNANTLDIATSVNTSYLNPDWATIVLRKLLENPTFKNDFINRFADLMNTSFLSSRIISKINTMRAVIYPEIPGHIARWKSPPAIGDYDFDISFEKSFANLRPTNQRNHIRAKFGISSNINATLNVSDATQGYIKINTINIIDGTPGISGNPYPWTGIYFNGIPVKLKAIAKPGFIFSHWTGASTSTNDEITITPTGNFSITAVFSPDSAEISAPIYFWMMDGAITNGAQLTSLNSTYEFGSNGVIQYQSCLAGYPYASGNPNFGKASMERRNNPTTINYRPEVNNSLAYASSNMRGLQIKQPFRNGSLENTMVFDFSTSGYKKVKFSFAATDEGAASGILIDYSVNAGSPVWITTGLPVSTLPLTSAYQLFESDFSAINTADNNPNFKIRLRFTGSNMTADTGARVTFNNIAVDAVKMPLAYPTPNVFTVGTAIANLTPSCSHVTSGYTISPALPLGLSLNPTSGVISGTPTSASPTTTYTVSASSGSTVVTFDIVITVNDVAPSALSYNSPNILTKDLTNVNLSPTASGGNVIGYSIAPELPSGLSFNTTTGVISGTATVISPTTTYTVTATNSGGSTTFGVVITVNDIAPSALSYNSPNVLTKNITSINLSPTVSGGNVIGYSIVPSLPSGLSFNTMTGVISGTATVISPTTTYTVTATNSGGSTTFDVVITVNDIAPSALSYNSPNILTKDVTNVNLSPTVSGGNVIGYSIAPALPSGLSINTTTGVISGTATVISPTTTYTVTATNSGGSTSFGVVITVNDVAPSALSYISPNVLTKDVTNVNLSPTVSGGNVIGYSIAPALPSGLSFNTMTGVISGTATVISPTTTYTVIATNSGGSTTFGVVITVNDIAPSALSYNSPNILTKDVTNVNLSPTVSGGNVIGYSITPALPSGLSFNTTTGVISGTATVISPTTTYTVTATNSGGSATFPVVITVNDVAPSALSYNSPNILTKDVTNVNLSPTVSGGNVIGYSIVPSLPSGLSFNTMTGVISGTATVISPTTTYTVTATNSGGSTTFDVVITVNDGAPSSLSYNSPNVLTKNITSINLNPTVSGGNVIGYSITPALPSGLSFNTTTGVISGTATVISPTTTYTVTATNSGGSATFGVIITVNDVAPFALSYNSPNVFTIGNTISNLVPSVTGNVISYSITPSLPASLLFDTSTGIISGTPTAVIAESTYVVTAMNSGGSTSFAITITINDVAPGALSYPNPNVFTIGSAIADLIPTISGDVTSYSVSPQLPDGLTIDVNTGIISGIPTALSPTATYTVTSFNSGGSTSFGVVITVNDVMPNSLVYNTPNVFTVGTTATLNPTVSGGAVTSYSVFPELPPGLSINASTGTISGIPTAAISGAFYKVTAANSGGDTFFEVFITINEAAPTSLMYPNPNVFAVGSAIADLIPAVTGNNLTYSISPELPSGLFFDTATGIISGTPAVYTPETIYIVTAANSGGSIAFEITIMVNYAAPTGLSYPNPNVFTIGNTIADLIPTVTGSAITYSISPGLPSGLTFDSGTGIISGTPTVYTPETTYTVTAVNAGGSTTSEITIMVNYAAPTGLSYPNPNVFTIGNTITDLNPTVTGSAITYSISPELPAGLSFDTTTGIISGTPTVYAPEATYTVIASNSGGSANFEIAIAVNYTVPSGLFYPNPNVFSIGNPIANLIPTVTGSAITYSISPGLPSGLTLDPVTGIISGTPTAILPATIYTVTATNPVGSVTFEITITINELAPIGLVYPNPNVFEINTAILPLIPSVIGAVTGYSINPGLPDGLLFDPVTGVISGTPSVVTPATVYTIIAFNSGGSVNFDITITTQEPLDVTKYKGQKFLVSPNPFTDKMTVGGTRKVTFYELYSEDGRLINSGSLLERDIEPGNISAGMYLLRLFSDQESETIKVIKK